MTAPAISAPAKGRLGNGRLRRQVAEWLSARPGPHTVGEIAKDLGRSAGAVGNALTTLADRAEASRLAGKPMRYEANAATAAAAAAITPKAPSPPKPAPAPAAPKSAASPAGRAEVGRPASLASAVGCAEGSRPEGRARPGHPPGRAGLPAPCSGRVAGVEALRTLRIEGVPALLAGPPGTGKTSLVEAAFPDLITVAGDGDTTVGDFVGEYTQKPDGTYEFIYGPLIRAMQEGRVLFIDDATLISPAVLAVCYPAMFSPEFTITEGCLPRTRAWLRYVRPLHAWVRGRTSRVRWSRSRDWSAPERATAGSPPGQIPDPSSGCTRDGTRSGVVAAR